MIKKFDDFSLNENESPGYHDIDARKDISNRSDLLVSTEVDPGHEVYPTISVYFPNLFMYIDLDRIDVQEYRKLAPSTGQKIGQIISDLDQELDKELITCIKNMQDKLKAAADKIHNIPGVTAKRYGL
jgi:hypothetical protein